MNDPSAAPPFPFPGPASRRDLLRQIACGFGYLAFAGLSSLEARAARTPSGGLNPLVPKPTHFRPRAKRVIFLFLHGGVSHIDTFDPKPKLTEMNGKPLPFPKPEITFAKTGNLLKSPWEFRRYGECGQPVSDLFPHIATCVDDLCMIHSMVGDFVSHGGAALQLHTGDGILIRPSMGSWILYGLGTDNHNLPGFINISPPYIHGGGQNFGSAFLPAVYQGTGIGDGATQFVQGEIPNLKAEGRDLAAQRRQLDLMGAWNRRHLASSAYDARLEARIQAFELAFRMQRHAPEALDFSRESKSTLDLYGIGVEPTDEYGRQCLLARRLAERGVRFVQVSHSYPRNYWDQHSKLREKHQKNALKVDKPIAGLLKDLKSRGLLEDTLVIFGTEFGRSPAVQGKDGRDHNPTGFTIWMAGGGIRPGIRYGATDEFGWYAVENKMTFNDFHATVLHLMGLDHTRLTYRHAGRDFRLTDVAGEVPQAILL